MRAVPFVKRTGTGVAQHIEARTTCAPSLLDGPRKEGASDTLAVMVRVDEEQFDLRFPRCCWRSFIEVQLGDAQ